MSEQKERKGRGPGFILGAFVGAIAGAAAALLFAPPGEDEDDATTTAGPRQPATPEPDRPPPYMTMSEDESLARVRAMLERVRARMREASAAGQEAARERERSLSERYAELTHSELPRSGDDAP